MGIATGTLEEGRDPAASAVNDMAKREWQGVSGRSRGLSYEGPEVSPYAQCHSRALHWRIDGGPCFESHSGQRRRMGRADPHVQHLI